MSTDVRVRGGTAADFDAVRSVARAAWDAAYGDLLDDATRTRMINEGYREEVLSRLVEAENSLLYVAEASGGAVPQASVVGYATAGQTGDDGEGTLDVFVHPDRWGDGIGTRLFDRALGHLAVTDVRTVTNRVLVENEPGRRFYRTHFREAGRERVDFGGTDRQVVVFEREIE